MMFRKSFAAGVFFLSLSMDLYAGTECIVVSGMQQDSVNAFGVAKKAIGDFGKCRVVQSWDDIRPTYPDGSQLLIIQAAHGNPGGIALCDGGSVTPENIIKRIESLASRYKVGVYLESCYSGDLMGKFIQSSDQTQRNSCLITSSVLNRVSQAGAGNVSRTLIPKLLSATTSDPRSLSNFFKLEADQGLISAANWEGAGFQKLILTFMVSINLEKTINNFISSPTDVSCEKISNFSLISQIIKMACVGIDSKDLGKISLALVNEQGLSPFPLKNPSYDPSNPYASAYYPVPNPFELLNTIPFFKGTSNFESVKEKCKNKVRAMTCVLEELLPKKCLLASEEAKKKMANYLLGTDFEAETALSMTPDLDPAALLHYFSKASLSTGGPQTLADQNRRNACESFVLGSTSN